MFEMVVFVALFAVLVGRSCSQSAFNGSAALLPKTCVAQTAGGHIFRVPTKVRGQAKHNEQNIPCVGCIHTENEEEATCFETNMHSKDKILSSGCTVLLLFSCHVCNINTILRFIVKTLI